MTELFTMEKVDQWAYALPYNSMPAEKARSVAKSHLRPRSNHAVRELAKWLKVVSAEAPMSYSMRVYAARLLLGFVA